ncbi:MAG: carbamoyltransferase HypF [Candidatus Geothermincolia bacterium]
MDEAREIRVTGIVQGVGFRPFVNNLAGEMGVRGSVRNTSEGVLIHAEGERAALERFTAAIPGRKPSQAVIEWVHCEPAETLGALSFEIGESYRIEGGYQLVSPDLATCDACRAEVFDPANRRYRYAFTNCTNCGPRFTIIADVPYDRPSTSMASFTMCARCRAEYDDPANRRFHAQPNACPDCGPRLELWHAGGRVDTDDPLADAAALLREGRVLAVKGLGGFHLACDATADGPVSLLRQRKGRGSKPFAVMVADVGEARRLCELVEAEAALMRSARCPIVLLREGPDSRLSRQVAPGQLHQGLMLPYTPLHHLLTAEAGRPLVMTSGNYSEEPIVGDNASALAELAPLADYFLLHDRDILSRYDDSVSRVTFGQERLARRSRSYAPYPLELEEGPCVLAVGAELKSTFCIVREGHAFVSQHLGDLDDERSLRFFEETVALYRRLFRAEPEMVAHDLHPDYLSTRFANDQPLPRLAVQHHHAHIASCLADNGVTGAALGLALDGMGYGEDGTIWGGELLFVDGHRCERLAHFATFRQAGGDAATTRIYRLAAALLYEVYGRRLEEFAWTRRLRAESGDELDVLLGQVERGVRAPLTSSCGRLFDAVASLLGLRQTVDFEGQAAMELEAAATLGEKEGLRPFSFLAQDGLMDWRPMVPELIAELEAAADPGELAFRFHLTLADMLVSACAQERDRSGRVALSGGVFQNALLARLLVPRLAERGFEVFQHRRVPCNDGGISLGQAAIARAAARDDRSATEWSGS